MSCVGGQAEGGVDGESLTLGFCLHQCGLAAVSCVVGGRLRVGGAGGAAVRGCMSPRESSAEACSRHNIPRL